MLVFNATGLCSVGDLYALDPRKYHGRIKIAVLHLLRLTVWEETAIVDIISAVVLGAIAPFSLHVCPAVVTLIAHYTPDSRRVPVSVRSRLPCVSYGVASTPDSNTASCSQQPRVG